MSSALIHTLAPQRASSVFSTGPLMGWLLCLLLLASGQWVLGPAVFLLIVAWRTLYTSKGPPVVMAAFTYQWLQVTVALLYAMLVGRTLPEMKRVDYEPMVLVGLAAIASLFAGYWLVTRDSERRAQGNSIDAPDLSLGIIAVSYGSAIGAAIAIQRVAWLFSSVTQLLIVLGIARFALLYMLVSRLMKPNPRWLLIFGVIGLELALGVTGYFAVFRESLVFITIAIISSADRSRVKTWIAGALVAVIAISAALAWTAIKPRVREAYSGSASTVDRLMNVVTEAGKAVRDPGKSWSAEGDRLVSRMWMIYYPSLVLDRVPSIIPHENGRILGAALRNTVMPRVFFPDKGVLASESDKVRKYAGVWVAGRERQTSFAFGYAAESYVDFGIPLMLMPILLLGVVIGYADRAMRFFLKTTEVQSGVRVVVLWSTMYLYESSWVMMIGTGLSLFVVLVPAGVVFERGLRLVERSRDRARPRQAALRAARAPTHHSIDSRTRPG